MGDPDSDAEDDRLRAAAVQSTQQGVARLVELMLRCD
jgi:hypothetical protein